MEYQNNKSKRSIITGLMVIVVVVVWFIVMLTSCAPRESSTCQDRMLGINWTMGSYLIEQDKVYDIRDSLLTPYFDVHLIIIYDGINLTYSLEKELIKQ